MKEQMTIEVREGDTLQLHAAAGPIGERIAVPAGVSSVTVIIRDTAGFEEAKAKRAARLAARQEGRGPGRRRIGAQSV